MNTTSISDHSDTASRLSKSQCITVLVAAFLGWLFAGAHMGINSITYHSVATSLLDDPAQVGEWIGFLVVAFLLGAAAGGYVFGWIGDRFGRSKAMAMSVACYSIFSLISAGTTSIELFWILRFITCMGIGGMWPNGMALLQEAWPNTAKPILAGILGTAANIGITLFSVVAMNKDVNPDDWQWAYLLGGSPLILAIISWICVPESPKWLAEQQSGLNISAEKVGLGEVFTSPHRRLTMIGIVLAFVPLFGGWGVANWANYWAAEYDEVVADLPAIIEDGASEENTVDQTVDVENAETGESKQTATKTASNKKAETSFNRAWPGSISSLLGGALAIFLGRKFTYAALCIIAFTCTQFLYALPHPNHDHFQLWVGCLGFFSGFFFGWLPLCLPEMFPTRVRATGSGVSFNFGRIIVAILIIVTSFWLKEYFATNDEITSIDDYNSSYVTVGRVCGFMYLAGIVAILMMPKSQTEADIEATFDEAGQSSG